MSNEQASVTTSSQPMETTQNDFVDSTPKIIPRQRRGKIDHSDPDHRCSVDHVRVPAHCRLKKNKRKRAPKPSALQQTL